MQALPIFLEDWLALGSFEGLGSLGKGLRSYGNDSMNCEPEPDLASEMDVEECIDRTFSLERVNGLDTGRPAGGLCFCHDFSRLEQRLL
jgi:hypothetical protein